MDFSTFKNKYVITGELTVKTALHIGSGKEKDDRDAPFISLDDDKNFYVPGSSFRGYLSTKLERFLDSGNGFKIKSNGEELNEADVKLIFGYTNLDKLETKIDNKDNEEIKKLKENNKKIQDRIVKKLNAEKLDEVKSLAGRIHISDMESLTEDVFVTRDGIKIDRNTGATEKGAKFDYDVVPAGTQFNVRIELENIEDYQLELLGLALRDIMSNEGDLLGGKTSRGIGRCKLENLKMEYVKADDEEKLAKYIFTGKFPYGISNQNEMFDTKNLSLELGE
ncbi:type III CRISPR-associated RAMP protein Csx7 [Leptotrichia trevisanii]|uniref:CRISPR-associated protein Csm3 n=1 Tax=Leptotrichia trevisanii TaxID=109328 RepID=A0A510K0K5_9FUSO|nr:CRISPR-associated RAMP protein Csx7 [Leptotrichia trevisanii]BBM45116.1 CRISPR-associated protein Csm3 [Leptotrichia trevisanii]